MAFNEKEQEIIRWGTQNGKSKQEIKDAIVRFRVTGSPVDTVKVEKPQEKPQKTGSPLGDLATGFTKGILEESIGTAALLQKGGQKVLGAVDPTRTIKEVEEQTGFESLKGEKLSEIQELLKSDNTVEKAGKLTAFIASIFTPTGARGAVKKTVSPIVENLQKTGREGAEAIDDVVGRAGTYAEGRLPKLLGIFSGESDDVVKNALRNPKLADIGIEKGDDALRLAIKEGSENSIKIRSSFIEGHKQAKNQILGQFSKKIVPKSDVKGAFDNLLRANKVEVLRDGSLDFTRSQIIANPGEVSKIKAAYEALNSPTIGWEKFSIDELDEYKQLVGKLTRFATEAGVPSKSPFLGRLYNELNQAAVKNLPKELGDQYLTLNKKFSETIDLYDDVVDAFNSGDPFTRLANALGKNKDSLREVLDFYAKQEGGTDILPIVAGRELAMEKTAAFGFLNPRSWIDLLISPSTQAKIITRVGEKLTR